jgi:hypothetical protein
MDDEPSLNDDGSRCCAKKIAARFDSRDDRNADSTALKGQNRSKAGGAKLRV